MGREGVWVCGVCGWGNHLTRDMKQLTSSKALILNEFFRPWAVA